MSENQPTRNRTDDCLAVCAPGAVISILLLVERIVLFPKNADSRQSPPRLITEEVYDLLVKAETTPVDELLFLTPLLLFDYENSANSLKQQVVCRPILGGQVQNWHFRSEPHIEKEELVVSFPRLDNAPNTALCDEYRGTMGMGTIEFPPQLDTVEGRWALTALKRTVFRCRLDRPIARGEQRWIRICISPQALFPPRPTENPIDPTTLDPGIHFTQPLDILGADTVLLSFHDVLKNIIQGSVSDEVAADAAVRERSIVGCHAVYNYLFPNGFERPGTYTRIKQQRIYLVPKGCKIENKEKDGCVEYVGPLTVKINGEAATAFVWGGGVLSFPHLDPIEGEQQIVKFLFEYAHTEHDAKTKTEISVAAGVEYNLCCELVDALADEGVVTLAKGGRKYFLSADSSVTAESIIPWDTLVRITAKVAQKFAIIQAQFRILYDACWDEVTPAIAGRLKEERRITRRMRWLAIAGFGLGILNLILRFITYPKK